MCLIGFAIHAHPACPLLIASNRDEYFNRPTAALHRWALPCGTEVLAGRDLREGGTWLGLSPQGRVAMLTNIRSAQTSPAPRSRGELVSRWLSQHTRWEDLNDWEPQAYGGFNLVLGDFHQGRWLWLSNRSPADPHASPPPSRIRLHRQPLKPGIYGLSNATLGSPWPKTRRITQALRATLQGMNPHLTSAEASAHPDSEALRQALLDDVAAPDSELPHTGVSLAQERAFSSPFVRLPEQGYGTRSTLLVQVQPAAAAQPQTGPRWRVSLREWTHPPTQAHSREHNKPPAPHSPPLTTDETLDW